MQLLSHPVNSGRSQGPGAPLRYEKPWRKAIEFSTSMKFGIFQKINVKKGSLPITSTVGKK